MKGKLFFSVLILHFFVVKIASAQTNELTGWGAWFYSQKFSKHWGILFDAQFRSSNNFGYLRSPLLRPSVSYSFNKNKLVSVGYLFTGTHRKTETENTFRVEHRILEQFILTQKIGTGKTLQHRFRLEQRFVNKLGSQSGFFAQRLRYFARAVVPFKKDSVFAKGAFVGLQNEIFVNVQNKARINNRFFDQNRAYAAIGYRLNKNVDLETGYLNQYINQTAGYTFNHVVQLALYTRF